ncbi:Mur ligase domain-containing protein, partial [Nocardioides sp. YIM 152588]|uniref:Mur ligase domain-containing protein n=1 Tax=Nocardioides sp. YIM 152588 TaxID=3158259 RepID=UPI0032E42922
MSTEPTPAAASPRPEVVAPVALTEVAGWVGPHALHAPAVNVPGVGEPATTRVTGVCLDSRRVRAGDLYAALPGATVHGARFAGQAAAAGATAILTDPDGAP